MDMGIYYDPQYEARDCGLNRRSNQAEQWLALRQIRSGLESYGRGTQTASLSLERQNCMPAAYIRK